ncbi:toxin glutamine deamidase domain-containing protein [Streptomyces kaempferi]
MQEIQRLTQRITDEFGIRFNSEAGVDALLANNPNLPASERSKVRAKAWDIDSLKELLAALQYFAPILGWRRAQSNMRDIPQGVVLAALVNYGILAGSTDSRVKGEYFEKSRLINCYKSGDLEYSANEVIHDITHELAHALAFLDPFQNKFWKGIEAPPLSDDERVVQNRAQDFLWSLIPYLVNDKEFQAEYPRRNQALKALERHYRNLFVRVGQETLREGAERITAALIHAVPWFGGEVGTWTPDGSRYYPMGPPLNEYGGTHAREDHAESWAYFFTDRKLLEEKSPERAAHISEEVNSWTSGRPSLGTTPAALSGRGQAGLKVTRSTVHADTPTNSGPAHPHRSAAVDAFKPNPASPGRLSGTQQARETGRSVSDTRHGSSQDRDHVTGAEIAADSIKAAVEGHVVVPGRRDARADMFVLDPDLLSPGGAAHATQASTAKPMDSRAATFLDAPRPRMDSGAASPTPGRITGHKEEAENEALSIWTHRRLLTDRFEASQRNQQATHGRPLGGRVSSGKTAGGTTAHVDADQVSPQEYKWLERVNPYRDQGGEFATNCVLTAIAVDMSLADPEGAVYQAPPSEPGAQGRPEDEASGLRNHLAAYLDRDPDPVDGPTAVVEAMSRAPLGARGMVVIEDADAETAHVINVTHDDNGVVFLDGQAGGLVPALTARSPSCRPRTAFPDSR